MAIVVRGEETSLNAGETRKFSLKEPAERVAGERA